jgi:IclR family transcriptional regulator, acetate operon repressor
MRKATLRSFPNRYLVPVTPEPPEQKGGLGTVRNATLLLRLLSLGDRFQTLSSLAEASGLSLATTHRVLRSLTLADLVVQDPQSSRYSLGPGLLRLSGAYRDRLPLLQLLAPYLVEVRDNTKATIEVLVLVQDVVVVADRVTGENVTRVFRDLTSFHPPLRSAGGRVLLGHCDLATWSDAIAVAEGSDIPTAADRQQCAEAPYLVHVLDDSGEFEVAVPVRDRAGRVVAALSATTRLPFLGEQDPRVEEHIARQLQRTAELVRKSLTDE